MRFGYKRTKGESVPFFLRFSASRPRRDGTAYLDCARDGGNDLQKQFSAWGSGWVKRGALWTPSAGSSGKRCAGHKARQGGEAEVHCITGGLVAVRKALKMRILRYAPHEKRLERRVL